MIRNLVRLVVFGLTGLLLADQPAEVAAQAERRIRLGGASASRVALVIGNSAYRSAPLRNPVNDARAMATALRNLNFAVTPLLDASRKQMYDAVEAFKARLRQGGVGVFYFAGHGVQLDGENYLLPVDSEISSESDVRHGTVPAGWVVEKIQESGNGLNVVILDACRNLPSFARGWRSPAAGLASMKASSGLLIAYSTAPGEVASDGQGVNSLYATHLLTSLRTPGQTVEQLFRAVRTAVVADPANEKSQTPWESSSLTGADFCFVPPCGAPGPIVVPPTDAAKEAFEAARSLDTVAGYEVFIAEYPGTFSAKLAAARIAELQTQPAPIEPPDRVEVAQGGREPLQPANQDGREMVYVAGGRFWMGCNDAVDTECYDDEKPGREVQLESFWLDKHEVTVAAYRQCVEAGRCSGRGLETPYWNDEEQPTAAWACNWNKTGRSDHPINCVNWAQAQAYCGWAGKRLPSEVEWEKGARGSDGRKYPWGNVEYEGGGRVANIADETAKEHASRWSIAEGYEDGYYGTAPVGTFPLGASPYGALDMVGNVWEWVADWYDGDSEYSHYNGSWYVGPRSARASDRLRSLRGGSWHFIPMFARASFRSGGSPSDRSVFVGFRCAQ